MNIRNVLLALCTLSSIGEAQGRGSTGCNVGSGFECIMVYAHEGAGLEERNWVRAIVLWKAEPWMARATPNRAEERANTERYDALRREAADSGRALIGTAGAAHLAAATMTWGFGRRTEDTVFVLGQRFELPKRDSALVIMIDARTGDASSSPRLVGSTWIPANLDPKYWPRHWTSGDTSFTINPPRDNRILRDALEKVPAARAFLASSP